jgi:hypothetical protein
MFSRSFFNILPAMTTAVTTRILLRNILVVDLTILMVKSIKLLYTRIINYYKSLKIVALNNLYN